MADENKKYTNRLRDRSSNEVYFVYDEEALHADSSISLLTNDAGYVKRTEIDDIVSGNTSFVKPEQLTETLGDYATNSSLTNYIRREELESLAVAGEVFEDLSSSSVDIDNTLLAVVNQNTSYKVATAVNAPVGTGESGILSVRKLEADSSFVKEEWNTTEGKAERYVSFVNRNEARWGEPSITVFDQEDVNSYYAETNDAYYLNAGGTYVLNGTFEKKITVTKFTRVSGNEISDISEVSSAESKLSTALILNGCFIESNAESAIEYPSRNGQLALVMHNTNAIIIDSENIPLGLSELNEHDLRSSAVIHSKSNIFLGGTGTLSITSNVKNHAIKGDNVSIKDCIQLYIDLQNGHDGINVGDNHRVLITDGHLTFKNCHDAIDGGIDGIVNILGGTITFENNEKDIDCSGCSRQGRVFNMLGNTNVSLTNSLNTVLVDNGNIRSIYGEPIVTSQDGLVQYPSDNNGVYVISTSGVTLSGYFNNRQIYILGSNSNPNKSVDIYLEDAYIENHERKTTSGKGQTVIYNPDTGKLAIRCKEGTVNFITQAQNTDTGDGYGAIKSKNNLTIQGAGSIFVKSYLSDAIDGSNVVIKGNGYRYFETLNENDSDPKAGICGKSIVIGEEDDVSEMDAETSYQTILASSILAKKNKNNEKGTIDILKYQLGLILLMNTISAETSIDNIFENTILDSVSTYANASILASHNVENRFENVIQRRIDIATPWEVFISASSVENKLELISSHFNGLIVSLQNRITKLEHKHLVHYPALAAGDYTDGNIEYWYCPECDEYYSDAEALHQITREETIIPKLIQDDSPFDVIDSNGNSIQTEAYDSNGNLVLIDVIENN